MLVEPKDPCPDKQVSAWAQKLYATVKGNKKLRVDVQAHVVRNSWYKVFAKLKRDRGEILVGKVLDWFCANINREFTPHAYSGAAFHDKFDQLVAAMQRDTPVEVTDKSRELAERYKTSFDWPVEVSVKLPQIVQQTRDNWRKFRLSLERILESGKRSFREQKFIEQILTNHAPIFLDGWISQLSDRLKNLSSYSGNPLLLVFTPSSELFRESFWRRWAGEYSASPTAFDTLLVKVIENLS